MFAVEGLLDDHLIPLNRHLVEEAGQVFPVLIDFLEKQHEHEPEAVEDERLDLGVFELDFAYDGGEHVVFLGFDDVRVTFVVELVVVLHHLVFDFIEVDVVWGHTVQVFVLLGLGIIHILDFLFLRVRLVDHL